MRMFLVLAFAAVVSAIAMISTISGANAQGRIYKYCLIEQRGMGGWGSTLCRFDTIAQCNASKNSPWDRCVPNTSGQKP